MWNFEVRKTANATAKAPRVAVAGPLISSVSREKLDLGDPPIVKIDSPNQAREFVRKLAEQKPDLVKIWYIVDKDHPVDAFQRLRLRFDQHFPVYVHFTNVKKLDLLLWQSR